MRLFAIVSCEMMSLFLHLGTGSCHVLIAGATRCWPGHQKKPSRVEIAVWPVGRGPKTALFLPMMQSNTESVRLDWWAGLCACGNQPTDGVLTIEVGDSGGGNNMDRVKQVKAFRRRPSK